MSPRPLLLVLLLLALVAISGFWLWGRLMLSVGPTAPPAAATVAPATPATVATPAGSPTPPPVAAGYRLAGVAVGEPDSFAVIEAPDGSTGLYRVNDDVPGLGELTRIEAERVVIAGTGASVELQLAPAATATPTVARTPQPRATSKSQAPGGGTARVPGP